MAAAPRLVDRWNLHRLRNFASWRLGVNRLFLIDSLNAELQAATPRKKKTGTMTRRPKWMLPNEVANLSARDFHGLRRIIDPPQFLHLPILHRAFDQLIAQHSDDAAADEERARVAVPVDARSATGIVDGSF